MALNALLSRLLGLSNGSEASEERFNLRCGADGSQPHVALDLSADHDVEYTALTMLAEIEKNT